MIVKTHKTPDGKRVVAVCDSELLGKKFEDDVFQLDLTSNFYKGEKATAEDVLRTCKKADVINLVGEKCINLAIKENLLDKRNVIKIKGMPHAQAVILKEENR